MVLGRAKSQGYRLEAFKFSLYLIVPVVATVVYNSPENMRALLQRYKFVEYPPEGPKLPTGDEMNDMIREGEKRQTYLKEQLAQRAAAQDAGPAAGQSPSVAVVDSNNTGGGKRWWQVWRRGGGGSSSSASAQ
ncbi:hypothetical protein JKP88DRAFT_234345 [Tribonema minus]|uniref:Uncharacterized protein n=1 Tax=Tribonema minus TaxID=303371 RepID=A0A836CK74_9STRA|nr:hypothetical protein JKP88DRAFT_234345 [Tribonema minus]